MATVLIAEDDADIRTAYAYALNRAGFEVVEAADGGAAAQSIEAKQPDLVLLDMLMPGMSGLDLLRQVQPSKRYPNMVVLALSNIDTPRVIEQAKELGVRDYIVKVDVTPHQMVDIIHGYLKV